MFRRYVFLAAVAAAFLSAPFPALADKRIALVVGNSNYQNVTRLENPRNDATLMATTLRSLGFTLVGDGPQLDLDKAALDRAVQKFGSTLQGADVAMFYYAGHGVQIRGANFLVPVGANPTREADVDFQMVDVGLVLRQMEGAGTRLNLVVLDACRNNPFGGRGLRATRWRPCPDARAGGNADFLCDPARQRRPRWRRKQPLHQSIGGHDPQKRARHLPDLQRGRARGEALDRRLAATLGLEFADRRQFLFFRAPPGSGKAGRGEPTTRRKPGPRPATPPASR